VGGAGGSMGWVRWVSRAQRSVRCGGSKNRLGIYMDNTLRDM
jgi:hypothetical protein